MIKHFFSVLTFIFIFFFIYFVFSVYVSNKNKDKININRKVTHSTIKKNMSELPLLKNDTYDVIKFNSGYDDDKNKIKRNFWDLFKKND